MTEKENKVNIDFISWLQEIINELVQIIIAQKHADDTRNLLKNDEKLYKEGSMFWDWLFENYFYSMVLRISRFTETSKNKENDDRSFNKFLVDLKKKGNYKEIISEDNYLDKYKKRMCF